MIFFYETNLKTSNFKKEYKNSFLKYYDFDNYAEDEDFNLDIEIINKSVIDNEKLSGSNNKKKKYLMTNVFDKSFDSNLESNIKDIPSELDAKTYQLIQKSYSEVIKKNYKIENQLKEFNDSTSVNQEHYNKLLKNIGVIDYIKNEDGTYQNSKNEKLMENKNVKNNRENVKKVKKKKKKNDKSENEINRNNDLFSVGSIDVINNKKNIFAKFSIDKNIPYNNKLNINNGINLLNINQNYSEYFNTKYNQNELLNDHYNNYKYNNNNNSYIETDKSSCYSYHNYNKTHFHQNLNNINNLNQSTSNLNNCYYNNKDLKSLQNNSNKEIYESMDLFDVVNHSLALSESQSGCRFLQRKIKENPILANQIYFNLEIVKWKLVNNLFGNYLIQTILEYLNTDIFIQFSEQVRIL